MSRPGNFAEQSPTATDRVLNSMANTQSSMSHEILMSMADLTSPHWPTPRHDIRKPFSLLREGANASVTDKHGNGAFHYLVQSGIFKRRDNPPKSRLFRRRQPPPVEDPEMTMEALIQGLQAAGADINLRNNKGETPLHIMCRKFAATEPLDEKLLESLIQAGADLNLRGHGGESAVLSLVLADYSGHQTKESGEHMCQLISRLGGRFDLRDCLGQTLLHSLLSGNSGTNLSLVESLTRHGVDPCAVDNEGNSLWHAVADRIARESGGLRGLIGLLLRLGVDMERPNNSGRNPLHCLSSLLAPRLDLGRLAIFPSCIPDIKTTAFDTVMQVYVDRGYTLDSADNSGVTPLHLASAFSEYQTRRLLQAGADPRKSTHDGLTPLHLSARCRQPNIIGILLGTARERELDAPEASRPSFSAHELVNTMDCYGRPALFYACASGRPESVAMLLDAGASVQSDTYDGSVWQACATIEEGEMNWTDSRPPRNTRAAVGSIFVAKKRKFSTERLDGVLSLLLQRQNCSEKTIAFIDEAISTAVERQHDYTVECLVQARNSFHETLRAVTPAPFKLDDSTSACLSRRAAAGNSESGGLFETPQALRTEFERLMCLRRYDLVQRLVLQHGWGELDGDGNTFVHDLAQNGFVSILREIRPLVKELSKKLRDVEWCDRQKLASSKASIINYYPDCIGRPLSPGSTQPLLLAACRSEHPNMEVVRFLVEEIGCDVNVQGYLRVRIRDSPTGHGICKHETPIHTLFRGRTHWWQTSEALPYLGRDHGANLEIRDCFPSTPLVVAAAHISRPTFDRRAFEKLLELGADAKAVDLTWASDSAKMTDLLLSHGAVLKPAALLAAVRSRNCDVLNLLISRGGDVNARQTHTSGEDTQADKPTPIYFETSAPPREIVPKTEFERFLQGDSSRPSRDGETYATPGPFVPEEEMYPLDFAAHLYSRQPEVDEWFQIRNGSAIEVPYVRELPADELERVIETLVARGAEVTAAYEFPGGARMTIKERIVLRGADYGRIRLGRPKRARRILELCKTTHEGEL